MQEVIARRKNGLTGLAVFCAVLGFIFAGVSIGLIFMNGGDYIIIFSNVIFLLLGIFVIAVCFYVIKDIKKTPQIILTYENGVLRHVNGTFSPLQIKNVEYRRAHARGISYRYGYLKIFLEDQTLTFKYVANVEQAHNRLIQLMLESREK